MVKIRLKRMGSKYNAFYRIVVADSRSPRDGKYIEQLGFFNPHTKEIKVDLELRDKWVSKGAQPSETVKNLFSKLGTGKYKEGVFTIPKKAKKPKKKNDVVVEEAKVDTPTEKTKAEAPAEE